jgi:hypothetical protein
VAIEQISAGSVVVELRIKGRPRLDDGMAPGEVWEEMMRQLYDDQSQLYKGRETSAIDRDRSVAKMEEHARQTRSPGGHDQAVRNGWMTLTVVQARRLYLNGSAFVSVGLRERPEEPRQHTAVKRAANDYGPVWRESTVRFHIDDRASEVVELLVVEQRMIRDVEIGRVAITVAALTDKLVEQAPRSNGQRPPVVQRVQVHTLSLAQLHNS